jgi:RNA polymerase sigma-70 factor (ECF subfamily)
MESVSQLPSEESFEDTILPYCGLMRRVAVRMTGSAAEADDLVQETLLRAFRSYDRLRPDSQVRPWLMRILHNTFVSDWRRRKRERNVLQPTVCEHSAPWVMPRGLSDEAAEGSDDGLGDEVVRALSEIPQPYRSCVLLVDVQDKSYKEAAELIGRPLGTVMSRLFRGRKMLQGKLTDYARREGFLRLRAA